MADKPIIFSAAMVRALLDGRKTQTRRVLKPQPPSIEGVRNLSGTDYSWHSTSQGCRPVGPIWAIRQLAGEKATRAVSYAPGDRLWVRETVIRQETDQGAGYQTYAACGSKVEPLTKWYHKRTAIPSIHMPRWASRLTLTVTDVRVQRLQEITGRDIIAEGVRCDGCHDVGTGDYYSACRNGGCFAVRNDFRDLWNSLHGPDAWGENPWVVALTFDVHRCNIDQMILARPLEAS